jgi:flagellar basal body P-ring protein FlgI
MKSYVIGLSAWLMFAAGCSSLLVRSQSPDESDDASQTGLVGHRAAAFGMFPVRVEAVGLVTGLNGTGSDPAPSPERQALIDDMQARGVANPQTILATRGCALVKVQGWLRPGIQKGDRFDLEVRVPGRSETTSLRGGWLMETRLTEMQLLGGVYRQGNLLAFAQGAVLIDPAAEGRKDQVMLCRGRVLGGGVCQKSRDLGLVLKPPYQDVFNASRVAAAINKRFHTFERGLQKGVAKARNDQFIVLSVHPRYKDNIARYMRVCQAIAIQETDAQRMARRTRLQQELLVAETAADAALQLEALGPQGVEPLLKALASRNREVRFYAAESLAYLDRSEAAEALGQIARSEPAFRVFALTALSAMDDYGAYEQLREMLDLPSSETRYGAFRALWAMNPHDPLTQGEQLGEQFSYNVLDTVGPPMIHLTHSRRAEIVLFGKEQRLTTPLAINAGNEIMITSTGGDEVSISRFVVNEQDQKRIVSTKLDEVIRTVVELGGRYPDVAQALQEAKLAGALPSRLEVDALPQGGRSYRRASDGEEDTEVAGDAEAPTSPAGELFNGRKAPVAEKDAETEEENEPGGTKKRPFRGFLARMAGREA